MKKIVLLIAFAVLTFIVQSQTLKGVTIGEVFEGELIKSEIGIVQGVISTTLGGIEGTLKANLNPTWLYFTSLLCITALYKISGTLHIFSVPIVCVHSLLHHISA